MLRFRTFDANSNGATSGSSLVAWPSNGRRIGFSTNPEWRMWVGDARENSTPLPSVTAVLRSSRRRFFRSHRQTPRSSPTLPRAHSRFGGGHVRTPALPTGVLLPLPAITCPRFKNSVSHRRIHPLQGRTSVRPPLDIGFLWGRDLGRYRISSPTSGPLDLCASRPQRGVNTYRERTIRR